MRSAVVVMVVTLAGVCGSAGSAGAQTTVGVGWSGVKAASTHGDEVRVGVAVGLYEAGHLTLRPAGVRDPARRLAPATKPGLALVADVRFGHEWGGGSIFEILGGLRLTNESLMKWPCYVEIIGGAMRFPGSTNAVVHPSVGVMFPMAGGRRSFYVQAGVPLIFFPGNAEVGLEAGAGLSFSIGK